MQVPSRVSLLHPRLFLILFALWLGGFPQPAAEAQEPPAAPAADPAKGRPSAEAVRASRAALEAERRQRATSRDAAEGEERRQQEAILEALDRLDGVYRDHLSALERGDSLAAEIEALRKGQAEREPEKADTSILVLDRLREELELQRGRESAVQAAVNAADDALRRAEAAEREAQATKPEAMAQVQARIAAAQTALRRSELDNARREAELYRARLANLEQRVSLLQKKVSFSQTVLREQLQRLQRETYGLERNKSILAEQEPVARARLNAARERLAAAAGPQAIVLEAEVEARRTEVEALDARRRHLERRLQLIASATTIWNRRHAIFTAEREQSEWLDWKEEARAAIDAMEQETQGLSLWLADWQNRLLTLENLNGQATAEPGLARWFELRRKQARQVVASLEELRTALENSRRLHQRLVDELNARIASRSLGEWAELTLNYKFRQNTVADWLRAAGIGVATFVVLTLLRRSIKLVLNRLSGGGGRQVRFAELLRDSVERTGTVFLLALALAAATFSLRLDPQTGRWVGHAVRVAVVLQMAVWISDIVRDWIYRYLARRTKRDAASMGALGIFHFTSQVLVWALALLTLLNSLGIDVTALVAGLGVGGVAMALALQRVLGDLFASLSIVLDKPFVIGDFIAFDNFEHLGVVEYIGIKTTRIRSLSGEQIVCGNSDLLGLRIRNFKRMHERRVEFTFGVAYETPPEKLEAIPGMIREIIEDVENTRFDRAHFFAYGDFALQFVIVYYVRGADYNLYMDIQQAINLAIGRRFREHDIRFAYPTQTLYLQRAANA